MTYLPDEGIWREARGVESYEVLIAGDAFAPSAQHSALLERVRPQVETLTAQARQYLDCFVRRAEDDEWFLESIDFTGSVKSFDLSFTLDEDTYGDWHVTFLENIQGFAPVEFGRRQV